MKNIDIVKIICKELGKPESLITHVTDRKGHDMRYAIDPTKIHNELGWLPETKFEDGIKKTIQWYLDNKEWWETIISGEYQNYYEKMIRNNLDLSAVPLVKMFSHLPIIIDPSHAAGRRDMVQPLSRAAIAAGADGLIIEAHNDPKHALCDGAQSLDLDQFDNVMADIKRRAEFEGRTMMP